MMGAGSSNQAQCEWGLQGVLALSERVAVLVIVDVLSFSTAVDVAVSRAASVIPLAPDTPEHARAAASRAGAVLAVPRNAGSGFNLSPQSMTDIPRGTRLMLPSPNGARLSLAAGATPLLAGCLRNARAIAAAACMLAGGSSIGVIPAGELWPDDSLRPAIEDLIGAGAILDALDLPLSPEARVARDAFRAAKSEIAALIRESVSGRELIERGFAEDVELAVTLDVSSNVALMTSGAFARFRVAALPRPPQAVTR